MNEAPEGLEYGTDNTKYARADMPESILEKGKYETAHEPARSEHEKAETLRMLGCCSHDPVYADSKKNR